MVCFLVHYYCEGGMCKLLCQFKLQSLHGTICCTFLIHQGLHRVIEDTKKVFDITSIIYFPACLFGSTLPHGTQLSPVSFALKLSSCIHCMEYDVNSDNSTTLQ
jgi:hypothetical protein